MEPLLIAKKCVPLKSIVLIIYWRQLFLIAFFAIGLLIFEAQWGSFVAVKTIAEGSRGIPETHPPTQNLSNSGY